MSKFINFTGQSGDAVGWRVNRYLDLQQSQELINDGFWEVKNAQFGRLLELHVFHDLRFPKLRPIILRPKSSRENVLELIDLWSPDPGRSSENLCGFLQSSYSRIDRCKFFIRQLQKENGLQFGAPFPFLGSKEEFHPTIYGSTHRKPYVPRPELPSLDSSYSPEVPDPNQSTLRSSTCTICPDHSGIEH